MLVKYEELSVNEVKFYIESTPEQVKELVNKAYNRTKGKYEVKGFRKGKAPKALIEQIYGDKIFHDEAFDDFANEEINLVAKEKELNLYGKPSFDDVEIEDEKMAFSVVYTILPMPEFPDYKGIEVPDLKAEVTEEDIDKAIKEEIKKNSRLVEVEDRAAKEGDNLNIDYVGTIDGEEFEGGSAEGTNLTIGEGRFIPGFEEQLIGANTGDDITVNVSFPEDYGSEELAGSAAVFQVKVNEIKEWDAPNFDDEYVSDISEFETVDEYKDSIKEKLSKAKDLENKNKQEAIAIKTFVEKTVTNIPDALYENSFQRELSNQSKQVEQYGMSLEDYARMIGKDFNEYEEEVRANSRDNLNRFYVLIKLAEKEDMIPNKEELDELVTLKAKQYNMTLEGLKKEIAKNRNILDSIFEEGMVAFAQKAIIDNVVYIDPKNFEEEEK